MAKVVTPSAKTKDSNAKSAKPDSKSPQKRNERQQMTLIGVIIVVVLAFFGFMALIFAQMNNTGVRKGNYTELAQLSTRDGAPILGDPTVPIVFREFANFACVHCLEYHSTMHEVIDRFVATGQARLEFRTLVWAEVPSTNAGLAALCAKRQGRFWDMNDSLFDEVSKKGASAYDLSNLRNIAVALEMDANQLIDCVINKQTLAEIEANQKLSQDSGLTGTPGVMISTDGGKTFQWMKILQNGEMVEQKGGGVPISTIENAIAEFNSKSS
ncbi:MAG: thioredoxin domain-containing protein [Anaerolineae bacterium]|nr:thioredoxin domain-containing protein [Anaerolineae bacterium]